MLFWLKTCVVSELSLAQRKSTTAANIEQVDESNFHGTTLRVIWAQRILNRHMQSTCPNEFTQISDQPMKNPCLHDQVHHRPPVLSNGQQMDWWVQRIVEWKMIQTLVPALDCEKSVFPQCDQ